MFHHYFSHWLELAGLGQEAGQLRGHQLARPAPSLAHLEAELVRLGERSGLVQPCRLAPLSACLTVVLSLDWNHCSLGRLAYRNSLKAVQLSRILVGCS